MRFDSGQLPKAPPGVPESTGSTSKARVEEFTKPWLTYKRDLNGLKGQKRKGGPLAFVGPPHVLKAKSGPLEGRSLSEFGGRSRATSTTGHFSTTGKSPIKLGQDKLYSPDDYIKHCQESASTEVGVREYQTEKSSAVPTVWFDTTIKGLESDVLVDKDSASEDEDSVDEATDAADYFREFLVKALRSGTESSVGDYDDEDDEDDEDYVEELSVKDDDSVGYIRTSSSVASSGKTSVRVSATSWRSQEFLLGSSSLPKEHFKVEKKDLEYTAPDEPDRGTSGKRVWQLVHKILLPIRVVWTLRGGVVNKVLHRRKRLDMLRATLNSG